MNLLPVVSVTVTAPALVAVVLAVGMIVVGVCYVVIGIKEHYDDPK